MSDERASAMRHLMPISDVCFSIAVCHRTHRAAANVNAPSAAEAGAAGDPNAGTAAGATDDVQMQDQ